MRMRLWIWVWRGISWWMGEERIIQASSLLFIGSWMDRWTDGWMDSQASLALVIATIITTIVHCRLRRSAHAIDR